MYGFSKKKNLNTNSFSQLSYPLSKRSPFIYGYKSPTKNKKVLGHTILRIRINKVTTVTDCNPSCTSCSAQTSANKENILPT